ncbi:hypothetical protein F5Y17DRAFT_438990 [Xylariaceae sp. FL0594]|nr:hypothetical protein F5Y17DRAFT_438990 [Xylariaceae sp. FL0594]
MPFIVFNNGIDAHLDTITDPSVRRLLADGATYTFASGANIGSLPEPSRSQVIQVYVQAMRMVWLVFVGISALGFFAVFIEKHVEVRKENKSEFGLVEKKATETTRVEEAKKPFTETETTAA